MNDQNKSNQPHGEAPKKGLGEPVNPPSAWKRLLSKRWVYPAVYVATAAIILTLVWVYQDTSQKKLADPTNAISGVSTEVSKDGKDEKAVEVIANAESLAWPVAVAKDVKIVKPYFDEKATEEQNLAAMVQYNDTLQPNVGVDLAREDNQTFEVKAALSGKVSRVENTPLTGTVVVINHANNMKTVYQSLTDAKVKLGDEVKQGDTLASAGRNEIEKDLGNHVHFEVYEKDVLVNPEKLLP
ncbi:M23 family metallopeptidase [Paenibacillus pini]|uniref:Stage II sporulation protein n=1 Tax=Paenibacillus pini JCM 16418 TaxID=1236976 RepID=W7Z0L7_9BACL|nr:M23 family metallopeptidase [Paenibacillus pini]GAF10516.1 stage II sporulation protein [Paenibacillus pini JCM 16418]